MKNLRTFCSECLDETIPKIQDDGIGVNEYHGMKENQSIKFLVSSCCGVHCVNSYGEEISVTEYQKIIDFYR